MEGGGGWPDGGGFGSQGLKPERSNLCFSNFESFTNGGPGMVVRRKRERKTRISLEISFFSGVRVVIGSYEGI